MASLNLPPLRQTLSTRLRSAEPTQAQAATAPQPPTTTTTTTITGDTQPQSQPRPLDRNIQNVVLGDILFKTWYPSFYPEELVGRETERLYVCRWCFKYSRELMPFLAHVGLCPLKDRPPPGRQIYKDKEYTIYEVDGEEHKLFTQNLSLFAKLFLDNKSVYYDVTSFLYYLLIHTTTTPISSHRIIGFFSKEKQSWDNNNLACILVFPPFQRRGMGQILMGVSYSLSRFEGRLGGPEKPLSSLGRHSYLSFWSARLTRHILTLPPKTPMTLESLSSATNMLPEDISTTLKEMRILETTSSSSATKQPSIKPSSSKKPAPKKKTGNDDDDDDNILIINKAKLREWIKVKGVELSPPVVEEGFIDGWFPTSKGEEEEKEA